jgi:hypothetical protein
MDEEKLITDNQDNAGGQEKPVEQKPENLPAGIARLHDEWVEQGLITANQLKVPRVELEPVIFPEPVGNYTMPVEEARGRLGLSEDALERLLASGELDSIQVRFPDGIRRMVSESALSRFIEDSGMDSKLATDMNVATPEVKTALDEIREEVREIRETQTRQLQQFKDILLLELRNLKDQDRDLTSFVYDLTEGLEDVFPKLKKRRRTPPP